MAVSRRPAQPQTFPSPSPPSFLSPFLSPFPPPPPFHFTVLFSGKASLTLSPRLTEAHHAAQTDFTLAPFASQGVESEP